MDATFDGVTYVKDRTETKASTDKIIGNYFTIVGLPIHKLDDILKKLS